MEARDEMADPPPTDRLASARQRLASLDPTKLWVIGLTIEPDGTIEGPGLGRFSFWADCECPGDCNRDHENE